MPRARDGGRIMSTALVAGGSAPGVLDAASRLREQTLDLVPQEEQRDDDRDGEEAHEDRVLRRRLTLFAIAQGVVGELPTDPRAKQDVAHLSPSPRTPGKHHHVSTE